MSEVDEAVDGDARLASSRRLDWRFLLPQPHLGRVLCVGRPDDDLLGSLARFSTHLETDPDATEAASVDVVVAVAPTEADLAGCARLLRPGGWLYAEYPAPPAVLCRVGRPHDGECDKERCATSGSRT